MLTDSFTGGVAENAFRTGVPSLDDPIQILAHDGIVRRRHNGSQQPSCFLCFLPLRDVPRYCKLNRAAVRVAQGNSMRFHVPAAAL
jgi:hypothetical protein